MRARREILVDRRVGRCWYCGEDALRVGDPPEHVVPAAIQGTMTTDHVCASCNREAGRIDQRFNGDYFIALERSKHDMRDRRGKLPPLPRQEVRLKRTGEKARINTRTGMFRL